MTAHRIPRTVAVNGVRYRVVTRPREHFSKASEEDGLCIQEQTLILLARELSPEQAVSTYHHEVGHAAFFESGAVEIMKDFTKKHERLEELLLQTFLPVYRRAMRNP